MALYLVNHQHREEVCPTGNVEMMMALGQHVTPENASKFGVKIHADVVIPGTHHLVMVLEADSPDKVTNFMLPFLQVGSVSLQEVKTCEEVVRTRKC